MIENHSPWSINFLSSSRLVLFGITKELVYLIGVPPNQRGRQTLLKTCQTKVTPSPRECTLSVERKLILNYDQEESHTRLLRRRNDRAVQRI